ncbi:YkvA family protein [Paenibacillus sp. ATY16]|uniref:YkvA family protein n=1 Tax=Paenibacillus sp. ATY16 TaxID=1759312 RepID=UPI00200FB5DE|nr:YkvA family protein [Paenibacillus sp. ATY16]MCK9860268.1 YkvA family protein [Paenibacillus sp. ATY16]
MDAKASETRPSLLNKLKTMARKLKANLMVMYLAYRDPRLPLFAKIFAICVVAYAFSPVDLIPDFIPVLGYLDDIILVPFGVYIALRLFPKEVLEEYRAKAEEQRKLGKPKNWITGTFIIAVWIALAVLCGWYIIRLVK